LPQSCPFIRGGKISDDISLSAIGYRLVATGVAKTTGTTFAAVELFNQIELGLYHRHKYHLCDTFTGLNSEGFLTAVPDGNHQLTLIIGIDQADQVAQYDAVFMAQTGTWQDYCRKIGICDVNSQAGRQ
jgi:hypothetical protein